MPVFQQPARAIFTWVGRPIQAAAAFQAALVALKARPRAKLPALPKALTLSTGETMSMVSSDLSCRYFFWLAQPC